MRRFYKWVEDMFSDALKTDSRLPSKKRFDYHVVNDANSPGFTCHFVASWSDEDAERRHTLYDAVQPLRRGDAAKGTNFGTVLERHR